MDDIDVKILKILQENARSSASIISSKVMLSISAVTERLRKLEASGIIKQYTTIIDGTTFGKELTAIMSISLESPKFTNSFIKFIETEKEILECHYIAGDYDYILKIVTKNTFTLEKLLTKIKSVPGIIKTNTKIVLSTIKNNYSISPDNINY